MKDYSHWQIAGHDLEYFDDDHVYLVDGIVVKSITQMLKYKFGNKYDHVSETTLQRASERGTKVHEAIQNYCENGLESELPELRNFKFLQKQYGFKVLQNEQPVILYGFDGEPISAGRLDMVIEMNGQIGLADIKRTSALDKEYLAHQLNLYRIAYSQSYGVKAEFLRGLHLREDTRKFVQIPVNEEMTWAFIDEYLREGNK